MFRVMIVEDEMLVRLGLKASIEWNKFDMEVIADVANGEMALDIYEKQKPDLILTDIKMPIMDGMQLITKIREKDRDTKIVILSCLEEFELVRKAMSLGVSDYILKLSMSQGEIETVLFKIYNELKGSNTSKKQIEQNIRVDDNIIKENIIKEYIFYNLHTESKFIEHISNLKINLNPERLITCVMEIDHFEVLQGVFKDEQGQLIRFSVLNILDELLGTYNRGVACHEKDNKYIILMSFFDIISEKKAQEVLQEILNHIRRMLKTYYNTSVTFGVSNTRSGYPCLKNAYKECISALEQKFFLGMGLNLTLNQIIPDLLGHEIRIKLELLLVEVDKLGQEYRKEFEVRIDSFLKSNNFSKSEVQRAFSTWIHWTIYSLNLNGEEISPKVINYIERIPYCETFDEIIEVYEKYLSEVLKFNKGKRTISKEIAEVIQYVQKNYKDDISVQQVADYVELSPNYLSNLFRKELHLNFIEYLTQYRIEKAKDLLLNTHLKSYEIADMSGFTDTSYFSRIFKKYVGMRPNEFRRQLLPGILEEMDEEDL